MNLIIEKLTIQNFKGIKDLTISFNKGVTDIYGANGTGKTSIVDAWQWLLTDKDSQDRKDFDIKNTKNPDQNRADHVVEASLIHNGTPLLLKKVFQEKWQKKSGDEKPSFTGNTTIYYFNDAPCKKSEFTKLVGNIISESTLKLITNPLYFNEIDWNQRRNVLMEISGGIDEESIIKSNKDIQQLMDNISGKNLDLYLKALKDKKSKFDDEIKTIKPRIDENEKAKPEPINITEVENTIAQINTGIKQITIQLESDDEAEKSKNDEIIKLERQKNEIQIKLNLLESKFRQDFLNEINERDDKEKHLNRKIETEEHVKTEISESIKSLNENLTISKNNLDSLVNQFDEWNSKTLPQFNDDAAEFKCSACNRPLEVNDIQAKKEELLINHNKSKKLHLDQINANGKAEKENNNRIQNAIEQKQNQILIIDTELNKLREELQSIKNEAREPIKSFDKRVENSGEHYQYTREVADLESAISKLKANQADGNITIKENLRAEREKLQEQLAEQQILVNQNDRFFRIETRIAELKQEEQNLASKIAEIEREIFVIKNFNHTKQEALDKAINGLFKYTTFKLFDEQVNGEIITCCEAVYDGVPYGTLNTAGRIWIGLDIINTLSKYYNTYVPIFIDGKESITELPEVNTQIINLIVSPKDKAVRFNG